jgi:enoyl-[acyl-carrier protein] reductase II
MGVMGNPVCDLLGIRWPILLGGMLHWGRARLAAAVSEAGGLGVLGAGGMQPEALLREIGLVRALTRQPFGVNIPLRAGKAESLIEAALAAAVEVFALSGGSPALYTGYLKQRGATVIGVTASVQQAVKAWQAGVDAIVAEGWESGGILGVDRVTTLALVPQVVDAVGVPVIAAGGIADGRGMAAALALGAAGIQMGTRFLAAVECGIPADYKAALVLAGDSDTAALENASGVALRTLKKALLEKALAASSGAGGDGETVPHGRAAGQSAGLIHEILPAGEIIRRIVQQAAEAAAALPGIVGCRIPSDVPGRR